MVSFRVISGTLCDDILCLQQLPKSSDNRINTCLSVRDNSSGKGANKWQLHIMSILPDDSDSNSGQF